MIFKDILVTQRAILNELVSKMAVGGATVEVKFVKLLNGTVVVLELKFENPEVEVINDPLRRFVVPLATVVLLVLIVMLAILVLNN